MTDKFILIAMIVLLFLPMVIMEIERILND